jgi:hypothetical protein
VQISERWKYVYNLLKRCYRYRGVSSQQQQI